MYLLYLDESGDPNSWQVNDHFVISGLAVHEGQVYPLTSQMDQIQHRFFPGISIQIPFHATDIRAGKGRFSQLSQNQRDDLMVAVYTVIEQSRFPNLVAFATGIHISGVASAPEAFREVFQDVCQRFNTFLVRQYNLGHIDKGLLVIDQAHEDRYRELFSEFRQWGTDWGVINNIVDIPYFARRRDTRMLQLADFCAYAVFRYFEKSDQTYFAHVEPRFDRRQRDYPPDGLKHIQRTGCVCAACHWR